MNKFLLCILVVAAMLLFSAVVTGAGNRPGEVRDTLDRFRYDWHAERVYEGTVGSKEYVVDGLMYFALTISDSDRTVEVQLGPEQFAQKSGFKVKIGEMVIVVGTLLVRRGRDIVLARKVSNMTSVLVVRDRDGHPMWDMKRPIQMDPELAQFHLCEMIEP